MKHFMDIEQVREIDIPISEDVIKKNNVRTFEVGDHIVIQEKIDGANASFTYEDGKLVAFSRKKELDYQNTLRGFWNWVQTLNAEEYKDDARYIFFGEMLVSHTVKYFQDAYNKFYFYDMYDKIEEKWMPQDFVKQMAEKHNLEYVHTFYDGEFISWDHVKSFLHSPGYGDSQEGCVIKNMTKLNNEDCRNPFYLKIVNDEFKETQKVNHIKKVLDPHHEMEKAHALELMQSIITENRIKKELGKMIDEKILPSEITPQDMRIVSKTLCKRVYDDCVKEEPEIIQEVGEYGGKLCNQLSMQYARHIILGT